MFIIKNENSGSPYWLLRDYDTGEDLPRTVIEASAYQFKTITATRKALKKAVDKNYCRFKGDYSRFAIIDLTKQEHEEESHQRRS